MPKFRLITVTHIMLARKLYHLYFKHQYKDDCSPFDSFLSFSREELTKIRDDINAALKE